jgi:hypothetical protein
VKKVSYSQIGPIFHIKLPGINENHEGDYDCTAKNKYGTARGTIKLAVRKPTILKPFSERSQTSQAGRALRLPCRAEHDPNLPVKYTWRIDGLPIDQSKLENGQLVIADDHTLIIENPTHYGRYFGEVCIDLLFQTLVNIHARQALNWIPQQKSSELASKMCQILCTAPIFQNVTRKLQRQQLTSNIWNQRPQLCLSKNSGNF